MSDKNTVRLEETPVVDTDDDGNKTVDMAELSKSGHDTDDSDDTPTFDGQVTFQGDYEPIDSESNSGSSLLINAVLVFVICLLIALIAL